MTAKELVDVIAPEHDRTSCSDDNLSNGLYFDIDDVLSSRCSRCVLLEIAGRAWEPPAACHSYMQNKLPIDFAVNLTIS